MARSDLHTLPFQALAEHAALAVFVTDEDRLCTYMNPAAERLTGFSLDEVRGRRLHDVIHARRPDGSVYPPEACPIEAALQRGVRTDGHELFVAREGGFYPVEFTATPIRKNGRATGTLVEVRPAAAVAEGADDEADVIERLHRIGQSLAAGLDTDRIVQDVTDAGTALTGAAFGAFFYNVINEKGESYTLYTISGAPREAFSRFPMPRNTPIFEPTFKGKAIVRSDDITRDPRYGRMAPHFGMPKGHLPVRSYLAVPVMSRAGDVIGGLFFGHPEPAQFSERHERLAVGVAGWAAVAMDNARLFEAEHRARAEAERANRAKAEFLATISHELRTPLNAMIGYTDLLLAGIPERVTEAAARKVERIGISARHLLQLIEEILTYARLEAGDERLDIDDVDLHELIEAVEAVVEPLALQKELRFDCRAPSASTRFRSDERKIRQILLNLLGNAVKFTSEGAVYLDVEEIGPDLVFRVRDSGLGIAAEHRDLIFDAFWQVEHGATRSQGGTGLGLSVARRLAGLLGGDLTLESEPGVGSTFTFRLPRAVPPPGA